MPRPTPKSPLRIGEVFLGEYQVLEAIGRGGYGSVYRAREEFTGREVALKLITCHDSKSLVSRDTFERGRQEAKILCEIEHPHIVNVYRAGQTEEGHIYIVMELLRGVSLAQRLREGPLDVEEGLRIIEALTDALALVHSKKIAHRDIKPANIIIREDGVAKLVDFGIAKVAGGGGAHTAPNRVPGTGLYISPEQLYSLISKGPRPAFELGDIYALGLVAFQMFQGKHPFLMLAPDADFSKPQVVWKFHLETKIPRLDEVIKGFPSAVALLVATALAKDPGDRLGSMKEFNQKARTARLNFLGRESSAHYRPLNDEAERPPERAAVVDTATIAPRKTKKQFNTDEPTRYVDISERSLERAPRPSTVPSRREAADLTNPPTPQAGSRTVTLFDSEKHPQGFPPVVTVLAGVLAGLILMFGVVPVVKGLADGARNDPTAADDIIVDSVTPLPAKSPVMEARAAAIPMTEREVTPQTTPEGNAPSEPSKEPEPRPHKIEPPPDSSAPPQKPRAPAVKKPPTLPKTRSVSVPTKSPTPPPMPESGLDDDGPWLE